MTKLAIDGGAPVRTRPFPRYVTIGEEEKRAVAEVMDSGQLSCFLGSWAPEFMGGPRVQRLERDWEAYFGVSHAISVNSATSGLYAAIGAAGVQPGDEVIVSPYTMTASATAALVYGGIPVFADIDPETFCLSPESIMERITPRTRAMVVVDIFGHPADFDSIMHIARERGIVVIEDAAQAPGATLHGAYAGTLADIGVFSLNYHKTIQCGEGGVVVTSDDRLADRVRLIRNHAEVVVKDRPVDSLVDMVGFNYRMTELEAAIATEQLKKLKALVQVRVQAAEYLTQRLVTLPGLYPPVVRPDVLHGFYLYVMRYDESVVGIPREQFAAVVRAEGVPLVEGYVEPIYLEPMYRERIAYGAGGYPWSHATGAPPVSYERGICPVTERMHDREVLYTNVCHGCIEQADLDDVCEAIEKVMDGVGRLGSRSAA